MNRPRWLAVSLLLMTLSAVLAQVSVEDFVRAIPKERNPNARANLDTTIDFTFYSQAGWRALRKGYLDTAEHEFISAIKAAKRLVPVDNRLVARGYADYAWALQKQKRYAEAEPVLKWVLTVREASFPPDALPIAQTRNQLATLYSDLGRLAEAEPLLVQAIAGHEKAAKPDASELARSNTLLGLLRVAQKRFPEAEAPFLKAVRFQEKGRGTYNSETGDAVNNLARTYQEQRKFDQAKPLFERALAIFEQSRGPADPAIALVLDSLARIDEVRGDLDEAEAKYLRAIGIWDVLAPAGAASRSELAGHFADFLDRQGRGNEAQKLRPRPVATPGSRPTGADPTQEPPKSPAPAPRSDPGIDPKPRNG
jgi:tetratricopeptide (TPR) repeat protein